MKSNKRTLKGTVLFTVVSVLSLMIIFLTSALVLASAANNRAHKSYSSSQVNYTARSAIDSVLAAVSYNQDFAKAVAGISETSGPVTVSVDMNNQGMGKINQATLAYAGEKQMYNPDTYSWEKKKLISVTAEVGLSGETANVTSYVVVDPIQLGGGGGGGGFLSQGDAELGNHTCAFGGTYIGMGLNDNTKSYDDLYSRDLQMPNGDGFWSGDSFDGMGADDAMSAPIVVDGSLGTNTQFDVYFQKKGANFDVWGDYTLGHQGGDLRLKTTNLTAADITSFADIPHLYVDGDLKIDNQFGVDYEPLKLKNTNTGEAVPFNIFCGTFHTSNDKPIEIYADIYCMNPNGDSAVENGKHTSLYGWASSVADGTLSYNSVGGNFYSRGNLVIDVSRNNEYNDNGAPKYYFAKDVRVEGNVTINADTNIKGDLVVGGTLTVASGVTLTVNGTCYADDINLNGGSLKQVVINGDYTYVDTESLKDGYTSETATACVLKGVNVWHNAYYTAPNQNVWVTEEVRAAYGLNTPVSGFFNVYNTNGVDSVGVYDGASTTLTSGEVIANAGEWDSPKTYPVYKDAAGNVVTAAEAVNPAGWYDETGSYLTDQSSATTIKYVEHKALSDYTGEIYPQYAYKEVLLNINNTYGIDNHIVKTVLEQLDGFNFGSTPTTIGGVSQGLYSSIDQITEFNSANYDMNHDITIDDDIRFTSQTKFSHDVYIEPDGHDVIIVVDSCMLGSNSDSVRFIVDDSMSGDVKFFITGDSTFYKMNLTTKSFLTAKNNNTDTYIYSSSDIGTNSIAAPNIYIYSSEVAKLKIPDNFCATAYIIAPYLDVEADATHTNALDKNYFYYDDIFVGGLSDSTQVNIIGCFDVKTYKGVNEYFVYYMDNSEHNRNNGVSYKDAIGEHVYEAVEYVNN